MAAKSKKPLKKKEMRIKTTSGAVLVADFDGDPYSTLYTKWRDACKGTKRADLFMTSEKVPTNLLEAVKASGTIERVYTYGDMVSPRSPNEGGVAVIAELDKIMNMNNDLQKGQLKFLQGLIKELESHTTPNSLTNPRNILFSDPVINAKGNIIRSIKVYGHYRTRRYQRWRSKKVDKKGKNKGSFESVPACPRSWYSEDMDTAKPPMWLALYSPDVVAPLTTKGILPIIEEYYDAVKDLTYVGVRDSPARITSRTIAQDLYEAFPEIRKEVGEWTKEGSPFLKTDLTLYGSEASESLSTVKIYNKGTPSQAEVFNAILKVQQLGIDVDYIYINVTPLQCTRMANMNKDYVSRLKARSAKVRLGSNKRANKEAARAEVARRKGQNTGSK